MVWGEKKRDWYQLVADIQAEIDANKGRIPDDRIEWIQHYLDHGEYSHAFEFLFLEIMERDNTAFTMGAEKAKEIALFFDLDNPDENILAPGLFWPQLMEFLEKQERNLGKKSF